MPQTTRRESVVGLHVADAEAYAKYRDDMTPLLEAVGGSFRYDFTIAETLKGPTNPPINRLFVIGFPDEATQEAFFSDPRYLETKRKHFEPAVDRVDIIATYDCPIDDTPTA